VLLVVRWGKTRRDVVKNATQLLRSGGASNGDPPSGIQAVLARVNLAVHARYRYGDLGEFLAKYSHRYAAGTATDRPGAAASPAAGPREPPRLHG
jgi:hypothetical protein